MLVTRTNFDEVLRKLATAPGWYALDTETTGLAPYKGDRIFSIIIARGEEAYYFNFNPYKDSPLDTWLLPMHRTALALKLFCLPTHSWYIHNAKFDMHHLAVLQCEIVGQIFCTYAMGRILNNDLTHYSLDHLSERWLGEKKSDLVKAYCDEHKLYDEYMKGKVKRRNYKFWLVPLDVIQEYAEKDGVLAYKLGEFLRAKVLWLDAEKRKPSQPPLGQVMDNEMAVTRVLFKMEQIGVQLDKAYAEKALAAENTNTAEAKEAFKQLTDMDLDDSPSTISKALGTVGVTLPRNKAGRALTNKKVLAAIKHPVVDAITTYRQSHKRAVTYYANFLAMCDENGIIHPDFHQGGTKTGRLSCRDPNLQNLGRPDEDNLAETEDVFEVRRCFVPRPDFVFFAPDYDQIEYRLMLEYAREQSIIDLVLGGMDVHTATAQTLGVSRFQAKTINFMLIYGGGVEKLAGMLKCSWDEAKAKRADYFKKLPKIGAFIERVRAKASDELTLFNWYGRRYTFAHADMTYTTAPNWLIQGGCADILKLAMIRCDAHLTKKRARSRMVLNVHDEIVFELHKNELELAPELANIMATTYPHQLLPLTVGPAYSWRSLADKEDGFPSDPRQGVA
jgi:DNA polymerase-1